MRIAVTTTRPNGKVAFYAGGTAPQSYNIECKRGGLDLELMTSLDIDLVTGTVDVDDTHTFTFEECGIANFTAAQLAKLAVVPLPVASGDKFLGDWPFTMTVTNLNK